VAVGDADDREITMTPVGASWAARSAAIAALGA